MPMSMTGNCTASQIMNLDFQEPAVRGRQVTLEAVWKLIGVVSRNISGAQHIGGAIYRRSFKQ